MKKSMNKVQHRGNTSARRHPKSSLRITATVLSIDTEESFYDVSYIDCDGRRCRKRIGRQHFFDPSNVANILMKAYWAGPHDKKKCIEIVKAALHKHERATRKKIDRKYRVTKRTGWYDWKSFVYPTETFGELAGQLRHAGPSDIDPVLGLQKGDIRAWREGLREPCKYSDYLLLAVSIPFAGPLLDIFEEEGATFHLHGSKWRTSRGDGTKRKSTSGKTLAARATASTMGSCRKNDLPTFAVTKRAVEDLCYARNGLAAPFDEEGRALASGSSQVINSTDLAYTLASGKGMVRSEEATRDQDLRNLTWAEMAISTGEDPLDTDAKQRSEGAQVRMLPVPVPPGKKGGIFNRLKNFADKIAKCKTLAEQVEQTISSNYGVAMPEYLRKLVLQRGSKLARRIRGIIDKFVRRVGADTEPWERRFATKFGIALAGAILAAEFGVAPWTAKRAWPAITRIYRKARRAIVSIPEAADNLLKQLRQLLGEGKRFPKINKGKALATDRAKQAWGVIKDLPNGRRVVLIQYRRIEQLVGPSAGQSLQELANRGNLVKAGDGKLTKQVMIKELTGKKRPRYVCFDHKALRRRS